MSETLTDQIRMTTGFPLVRAVSLLAFAKGDPMLAGARATELGDHRSEMILRGLIAPGMPNDPEWAAPLEALSAAIADFVSVLRPATIVGRLGNLRRIPFQRHVLAQTVGASASWVGAGAPKPLTAQALDSTSLQRLKVAAITVQTAELVRFADSASLTTLRTDLVRAGAVAVDSAFINPGNSGIVDARPAAVTHDAPTVHATGSSIAAILADLASLTDELLNAGSDLSSAVFVMHAHTARSLSLLRGTGGSPIFPDITIKGGSLLGLPVLVSASCLPTGSPGEFMIVLCDPSRILFADDAEGNIAIAKSASLQMVDNPASGAQQLVSLFQRNLVGVLFERYLNWTALDGAVAVLDGLSY